MSITASVRRTAARRIGSLGPDSRLHTWAIGAICARRGVKCAFTPHWVALRRGNREIRLPRQQSMFAPVVAREFEVFATSVTPTDEGGVAVVDFSTPALHHYLSLEADFEMPSFPEAINFDAEYFRFGRPEP